MTINEKFASMGVVDLLKDTGVDESAREVFTEVVRNQNPAQSAADASAFYGGWGNNGVYSNFGPMPIMRGMFNGEKSQGALGMPMDLLVDPRALRFRAYEANTTSDVINIITGKFFKWVIGNGLKFQSQPSETVLKLEKIKTDFQAFKENAEAYFQLYADSTRSDYSNMDSLHVNAAKAFETAFLGGDCLVILRVDENYNVTSQVIDGQHVNNPTALAADQQQKISDDGHFLRNGIVMDQKGKHVAYYVRKQNEPGGLLTNFDYERVEAYSKDTGCLMAWMVYGKKNRIDHNRGITMLSAILEKVTSLDRYTEATVQTAEERAKVVHTLVHGKTSTGESHLITGPRAKILGETIGLDGFAQGALTANQMALTENRNVYNLPVDSELKTVSSQQEINYEPFFKAIFMQLCAAVDMPPEVALQQYNSNYSASRAAINGWGYIVDIYRKKLAQGFYKPFYDLWLYVHVLRLKVDAPGYLEAKASGNVDIIEAYSAAKFTGVNMPHIDPYKEIKAIREAMGTNGVGIPLISNEQAADLGGYGDWYTNMMNLVEEKKTIDENDLDPEPEPETTPNNTGNATGS